MTLLGFRVSITTGPKDVMDIPSECIFNSLIWNTQLNQVVAIQSIFINLFLLLLYVTLKLSMPCYSHQQEQVKKMKWLKRYKTCLTKQTMHQRRQANSRLQAVQQLAILAAVLETTAELSLAATVMWSVTTSTTAVMTSQLLAATVSVLYILCVPYKSLNSNS